MRWRILALLFLARMGLGIQFQTVGSVGDDLGVAFGLGYAEIGIMIGLFMAPGLVLALPAGYLGRFVSDRLMVVFGLGALALGGFVSSQAGLTSVMGLGRVLAGVGFLFCMVYFTKMVADWFEGGEIATAMSLLVMSWPMGIAIGQIGHVWLAQNFGWHVSFLLASTYCLILSVAVFVFYRTPHDVPPPARGSADRLTRTEWQLIFCAGTAWGIFNAAYVTYLSFGPLLLESLGQMPIAAAGIISIASWIMIASGAVCGQIVDRLGRRTLVVTICMGGAIVSMLLLGRPGSGVAASVLFGLIGMAPAGAIMAMAGQAMRPQVRAFGMGVFFTIYHAAMLATPPLAGAVLDATGQPQSPIWIAIVLFAGVVPLAIVYQSIKSASIAAESDLSQRPTP